MWENWEKTMNVETNRRFGNKPPLLYVFVTIKIAPQSTYALISLNENGKVTCKQCLTFKNMLKSSEKESEQMHSFVPEGRSLCIVAPVFWAMLFLSLSQHRNRLSNEKQRERERERRKEKNTAWKLFSFVFAIRLYERYECIHTGHHCSHTIPKLKVLLYTDEN